MEISQIYITETLFHIMYKSATFLDYITAAYGLLHFQFTQNMATLLGIYLYTLRVTACNVPVALKE